MGVAGLGRCRCLGLLRHWKVVMWSALVLHHPPLPVQPQPALSPDETWWLHHVINITLQSTTMLYVPYLRCKFRPGIEQEGALRRLA